MITYNIDYRKIAKILKNGGVVIMSTETLYGLICDATNLKALKKIYLIKNRPKNKAFPIVVKDLKMLKNWAEVNKEQEAVILKATKPTNFILKAKNLPKIAMQNNTVAFRITTSDYLQNLFRYFKKPLVATSANLAGEKPLTDPRKYQEVFGKNSKLIEEVVFAGINRKTKGSQIIDLTVRPYKKLR